LEWFFVPTGQEDSTQGFNLGNRISAAKSPEGAADRARNAAHQSHRDLDGTIVESRDCALAICAMMDPKFTLVATGRTIFLGYSQS
jgi:hypothetical protein